MARVLPLLAALSESSGAAAPCLARACLQLKAKSRLAAGKIAAGLQDVIAAHGGRSGCIRLEHSVPLTHCLTLSARAAAMLMHPSLCGARTGRRLDLGC